MKKQLLCLMLSACILCAVSLRYISKDDEISINSTEELIISDDTGIQEQFIIEESTEDIMNEAEYSEDLTNSDERNTLTNQENIKENGTFEYAYSCLCDEDKKIYREIYDILMEFGVDRPLNVAEPEQISVIFQCVLNDHPEIFYVEGYTYTTYMRNDVIERLTITGSYTMTKEEADFCREGIELYADECLAGMKEGLSDYEKVKYVYEYLISHTEYNQHAPENQNICSVFLNGESVCQGYAKATQYLLNKAGVFCTLVIGSVSAGEGHAWNLVLMDGNYYYVDTTWGDASYQTEEGTKDAWESYLPEINYDYLGVTTEQLQKTHILNNVVPMPFCISTDCNYYVREGTYLSSSDEESISNIFGKALSQNKEYITLKCSDAAIYDEVKRLLLDEQKVFEYLHKTDGSVAYSDNEQQLSLSFWLWDES